MSGLPEWMQALLHARAYPHAVRSLRLVETPISWVLLTGEYAYKIKRPVKLPFVDLRSAAHRRFLCHEELRLNRRFAPGLYLDVCDVTRTASGVRMGGGGEVIEAAVRMRQFDTAQSLDALIARGEPTADALRRFGAALDGLHATFATARSRDAPGDPDGARADRLMNVVQARGALARAGIDDRLEDVQQEMAAQEHDLAPLLERRWRLGKVRECHGDLHSRNIVLQGGELLAFDGLEFEPRFRWIDLGAETAFLAMDLMVRGALPLALSFLSGYLESGGDYEQLRALPLHLADRALVRAKVAALEATDGDTDAREASRTSAMAYVALARERLDARRPRPRMILMHGLSGSGKSWLAARLAERLPALHVRSDVVRRHVSRPGTSAYSSGATARTYGLLAECAADALAGGLDVIVDATFLRRANRADFRRMATIHGARLSMIQCEAPDDVLRERIAMRATRGNDPSEATVEVLSLQRGRLEPVDAAEGLRRIVAQTNRPQVVQDVLAQLDSE